MIFKYISTATFVAHGTKAKVLIEDSRRFKKFNKQKGKIMNTKGSAWFFLFLVCSAHIGASLAQGIQTSCGLSPDAIQQIKARLLGIQKNVALDVPLPDQNLSGILLSNFHALFKHATWTDPDCVCQCLSEFIKISIKISILNILFSLTLSLAGDVIGGLLSPIIALLQDVVQLVLRILSLRVDLNIILHQPYDGNCKVHDVRISIGKLRCASGCSGLLDNIIDLILNLVLPIIQKVVYTLLRPLIIRAFVNLNIADLIGC